VAQGDPGRQGEGGIVSLDPICEHPAETREGLAERGENRADQHIGVENNPLNSIAHEPLELRVGQAALGRLALDRGDRLAQTRLGLAADAVLLFQSIEFGRRQHHGHRLAFFQNRHRFVTDGLDQLAEFDLSAIVRQRSHSSSPFERQ
jgi:hypothetical protein